MNQTTIDDIYGHLSAYDMLLRGLYANFALEQDHPSDAVSRLRDEMLSSIEERAREQTVDDQIFVRQKAALNSFFDRLDLRMRNLGA